MRQILIAASVLALATSTAFAAPKKKPATAKKVKRGGNTDRGSTVDPGAIEMDDAGSGDTDAAEPGPPAPPQHVDERMTAVAPAASRPLAMTDRPLTIGKHRLDVHGALPIAVVTLPDITGDKISSTSAGLALGATYGIDDTYEVGADYAISFHPGDVKGALTLHGAALAIAKPSYDLAIGGAFVLHPIEYTDPASGASSTMTYAAIQAGAWFRYRPTAKLTVFTGLPALPHPDVSLSRSGLAFPPMPYQLTIGLNNSGAVGLGVPIGVGYQAAPSIYAFVATNIANIRIAHTSNAVLFKDFIPLTLGGFYSLPHVDIGAVFSDDLRQAADYLSFSIVARYRFFR